MEVRAPGERRSMEGMRIILLAGRLHLNEESVYTLTLGRALVERGHEVHLVAGGGSLEDLLRDDSLAPVRHGFTGSRVRDVFELHRVAGICTPLEADVLHVTTESLDSAGQALAKKLSIPRVVTFHGRDGAVLPNRRAPDAVIVPAQGQRATVVNAARLDRARVRVIPYGLPERPPTTPRPLASDRRPSVGALGPLRRGRGLKHFVGAMAKVAETSNAIFPIIGSGPYHRFLRRHAEPLGARCIITDLCVEPSIAFSSLDVIVFPCVEEEFGCLALVAMSLGRPVVASAVGHAFDLLEDGVTGYLVPPRDEDALAERVLHLLEHPEESAAMGDRARERARELHPLDAMVSGTLETYRSVAEHGRATSPSPASSV